MLYKSGSACNQMDLDLCKIQAQVRSHKSVLTSYISLKKTIYTSIIPCVIMSFQNWSVPSFNTSLSKL